MVPSPYKLLAERLDAMPNGFPPTADGTELKLLEKLFTPEEAALAAQLRVTSETADQISVRIGSEAGPTSKLLKGMARHGLIGAERNKDGLVFRLLPFVVGFFELQAGTMDAEFARLYENYYRQVFAQVMYAKPQIHRVIPVNKTVGMDVQVEPFESVAEIVAEAKAWGVLDCVCRKQKMLIGEPCKHTLTICMALSQTPNAFKQIPGIHPLTQEEALAALKRAAEEGLVHQVSNNQQGIWYICNCCTCSCGILRGMADLGMANVVARSAFVNQIDSERCIGCELCVERCQFGALAIENSRAVVDEKRCVGCGVCVLACDQEAMLLVRRPADQVLPPPLTEADWRNERAVTRGINLDTLK
jgi:Na+-translocating ferredoxin:NAD+ oxidoreductase subunit B